jgi:hypothetical protein
MKQNYHLIGSASNMADLAELIKNHWYWNNVSFINITDNEWSVSSGRGKMEGLRIIFKKGRYRLERKQS